MKSAERPPRPQSLLGPHADIDRGLDDKLWNIIEDCWSQEPSNRPTAELVSLRLRDVNGYPVTVKPQVVVQPQRTVKQVQDRNTSINKHSTAGRAGWINSRSQPNVVPPLAQLERQEVRNSTEIRTTLCDKEKYFSDSITRCVPINE